MPKDTQQEGHPYRDNSPVPVIVAIIFLLVMGYAVFSDRWKPIETPRIDDRQAYGLSPNMSLPLTGEVPTLYSSTSANGKGVVADTVGERGLWLASEEHQDKTFAILSNSLRDVTLEVGQPVYVEGKVYRCEGLNRSSLNDLSAQTVATLEDEDTFVYIESIKLGRDATD